MTTPGTNEVILLFLRNGSLITYHNQLAVDTTTFDITMGRSIYSNTVVELIAYSDGRKQSYYLQACNKIIPDAGKVTRCETLILQDECYDCYRGTFKNVSMYLMN